MLARSLLFTACAVALAARPAAAQDPAPAPTPAPAPAAPAAVPAAPQDTGLAVRPGMTEIQVRARWGDPIAVRRMNDWTYLFYRNGQERQLGYYDVVMLQNGQVMDAIVRAPEHVYGGVSSSPPDRWPEFTPPAQPPSSEAPGAVTGVRVQQAPPAPPPQPEP